MPEIPFITTIVQYPPVFLNLQESLEKAVELIAKASQEGAKLIVFPETWLTGYPMWLDLAPGASLWGSEDVEEIYQELFFQSPALTDSSIDLLGKAAKSAKAVVVMGMHERSGNTIYNTMLYLDKNGEIFGYHRKLIPTYSERLIWGRGDGSTLEVFDTPLGRMGGLICWEHWMPLARFTYHSQQEQIHIAQWPTVKTMHQVASRHYAFEGRCIVIAAGTVLHKDDLSHLDLKILNEIPEEPKGLFMRGGSCIIAPDGSFLAEPVFDQNTLVSAEVDPAAAVSQTMTLDVTGHYSRPDIFTLRVNKEPQSNIMWDSKPKSG